MTDFHTVVACVVSLRSVIPVSCPWPGAIFNFAERYLARPNMAAPDGKRAERLVLDHDQVALEDARLHYAVAPDPVKARPGRAGR